MAATLTRNHFPEWWTSFSLAFKPTLKRIPDQVSVPKTQLASLARVGSTACLNKEAEINYQNHVGTKLAGVGNDRVRVLGMNRKRDSLKKAESGTDVFSWSFSNKSMGSGRCFPTFFSRKRFGCGFCGSTPVEG